MMHENSNIKFLETSFLAGIWVAAQPRSQWEIWILWQ